TSGQRGSSLVVVATVVGELVHTRNGPLRKLTLNQLQLLSDLDVPLSEDAKVPASSSRPSHESRKFGEAPSTRKLPAGLSRLRDLDRRLADPEHVSDAYVQFVQPV